MACITVEPLVKTDSKRDWSIKKMAEGSKKQRKIHAASWVAPLSYTTLLTSALYTINDLWLILLLVETVCLWRNLANAT